MQKLLVSKFLWGDLIEVIQLTEERRSMQNLTSAHRPGVDFQYQMVYLLE
jgi:hypothetical protein